ncbi:hypothetical protein HDU96_003465 [Phlyctochytrium bullatum]|nr:hypothetical protein HDU96_003465 [Phlyctochytrium bullatum]
MYRKKDKTSASTTNTSSAVLADDPSTTANDGGSGTKRPTTAPSPKTTRKGSVGFVNVSKDHSSGTATPINSSSAPPNSINITANAFATQTPLGTPPIPVLQLEHLPGPILKRVLRHCAPHLARLTRLSKGWRVLILNFADESTKRFREQVEEAECWSHRPPTLADDVMGCDPIVLQRILWDVYAPRIIAAAATLAGSSGSGTGALGHSIATGTQNGQRTAGGWMGTRGSWMVGGSTFSGHPFGSSISAGKDLTGKGDGGVTSGLGSAIPALPAAHTHRTISRAVTSTSAIGAGPQGSQSALSRLTAYQRQLFRSFRIALDTFSEGGWASVAPLKDFIRKTRLHYEIPQSAASAAPALSLLADGVSSAAAATAAAVASGVLQNLPVARRASGIPGMLDAAGQGQASSGDQATAGGGNEVAGGHASGTGHQGLNSTGNDIEEASAGGAGAGTGAGQNSTATATSSTAGKAPPMPSTTASTSTATATLLTAQDIRPRPPRDTTWFLLNADLCRLASAYGFDWLLPTLADLDPDAAGQVLTLATSDATRHRRHGCLASLLDSARLVPGALWPCLDRGLGSAIQAEEDGCPSSGACVLLLLDAACNDPAGPRTWVESVGKAGSAGGGIIWGAVDARERMASILSAAHAATNAAASAASALSHATAAAAAAASAASATVLSLNGGQTPLSLASRNMAPSLSSMPSLAGPLGSQMGGLTSPPPGATASATNAQGELAAANGVPQPNALDKLQQQAAAAASAASAAATAASSATATTTSVTSLLSTALISSTRSTLDASELASSILEKVDEVRKVYGIPWHRFPRNAVMHYLGGGANQNPFSGSHLSASGLSGSMNAQSFAIAAAAAAAAAAAVGAAPTTAGAALSATSTSPPNSGPLSVPSAAGTPYPGAASGATTPGAAFLTQQLSNPNFNTSFQSLPFAAAAAAAAAGGGIGGGGDGGYRVIGANDVASGLVNGLMGRRSVV